jgi:hypothetical protein
MAIIAHKLKMPATCSVYKSRADRCSEVAKTNLHVKTVRPAWIKGELNVESKEAISTYLLKSCAIVAFKLQLFCSHPLSVELGATSEKCTAIVLGCGILAELFCSFLSF